MSVVFIPLFPPPPPFQPENILLTARKEKEKQSLGPRGAVSLREREQELLRVPLPGLGKGGFDPQPFPTQACSQNPARQEGRTPSHRGSGTPIPLGDGVWERSPQAGRGPLLTVERGLCFWASGQRGFRAALAGPRGLFLPGGIGHVWNSLE